MKKILVAVRLEPEYAITLRTFPNQNKMVERGLRQLPEFKAKLEEQEAYGPTNDNQEEQHPDAEAVRQEFTD